MWKVETLCAANDKGHYVTLIKDTLTLYTVTDNLHISKKFKVKETPPCLSVAVADLIKMLAKENTA